MEAWIIDHLFISLVYFNRKISPYVPIHPICRTQLMHVYSALVNLVCRRNCQGRCSLLYDLRCFRRSSHALYRRHHMVLQSSLYKRNIFLPNFRVLFMRITPKSGAGLHKILLHSVMRAPQSFFDETDSGVTLNRFSQDMTLIDGSLPSSVVTTLSSESLSYHITKLF
jgi:hypothetical protein